MPAKIGPGLAFAAAIAAPALAGGEHPVRLVSERQGNALVLTVVGDSPVPFAGTYALEVAGGAGTARSVQRGSAALLANRRVVLVRLMLGGRAAETWRATLRVRSEGGDLSYQESAAP